MAKNIISMILSAPDHRVSDAGTRMIMDVTRATGSNVRGPIPLPAIVNEGSIGTRNRRLIEIEPMNPTTIEALVSLDVPASLHVDIRA